MKTKIITSLKSRVLLVDGIPEDAHKLTITDQVKHPDGKGKRISIMYYNRDRNENESLEDYITDNFVIHQEIGNWNLLGKLKDLTGDDVRGLVQKMRFSFSDRYLDYKPYLYSPNHFATPKQSFLSALESEGLHLHGNPIEKCSQKDFEDYCTFCSGHENLCIAQKAFLEAEQNVFSPETLIFVEL